MTTHDYTNGKRRWGHNLAYSPIDASGLRLRASGWGRGIAEGDYILLSNGIDETRYQFESIDYYANPNDMWSATLKFAPRQPEQSQ